MANIVQDAKNFALDFIRSSVATGADVANSIGNAEVNAAQHLGIQPKTGSETNQQQFGNTIGNFAGQDTVRNFAENVAQVAASVAAPAIARPLENLASPAVGMVSRAAENVGGKVVGKLAAGAAKGAVGGAGIGGVMGVTQGVTSNQPLNAKNLSLDFLQGAGAGAEQGAVFGAAGRAKTGTFNATTAVGGPVGYVARVANKVLSTKLASQLAAEDDPAAIEKKLEPITGLAVARDVAGAVAKTNDPNIVENIVQNDTAKKLNTGTPLPSSQSPETNLTPVNTPPEPEQGRAAPGPSNPNPAEAPPAQTRPYADVQKAIEDAHNSGNDQLAAQLIENEVPEADRHAMRSALGLPEPEASSPTSQEEFIKPPESGPRATVLEAMSGMTDILNTGGTVDEALNHYMESTGEGYGAAKVALAKVRNQSPESLTKGNINAKLNPRTEEGQNLVKPVLKGDTNQAILNGQTVHNAIIREGNKAIQQVRGLNSHDMRLMDELRTTPAAALAKQADDQQAFLQAAESVKNYNDLTQSTGAAFGQEVPYRQNYGAPLLFKNSEEEGKRALKSLKASPGYTKGRFFKNYDEAAQFGLDRRNPNFLGDLEEDVNRRTNQLSQLALAKGLEEAHPGQVSVGQLNADQSGTYRQLLIPHGQRLFMPQDIAGEINKRAPIPDATGALKGYDTLNANLKNLKLGGGGFHAINVAGSFLGQQLMSGKLFTDPGATAGMIKSIFSPKAMEQVNLNLDRQGYLRAFDQMGLKYGAGETAADVEAKGRLANLPGLKQTHEAIFNRQIPYMKQRVLQQWMDDHQVDPNNMTSEQIQAGRQVAQELNRAYGGINRTIDGLTPQTFKRLSRVLLATDYTEGQLRTLADAFTKGGEAGKFARQTVAGKALLFAGIATVGGLAGGEFKGKNPQQVASDIIQKAINPAFQMGGYTVSLPETQLSEFVKPIATAIGNKASGSGRSTLNPFKDFFTARAAALPSEAEQLIANRDFYGNPIHGSDYYGRPISPLKTAENVASGLTPVPVTQGLSAGSGKQSVAAAAVNTLGLRATPTYDLDYSPIQDQTYVAQLKQNGATPDQVQADTEFFNTLGNLSRERKDIEKQVETDIAQHNLTKANKDMAVFNQKLIKQLQPWAQNGGEKYFDSYMAQQLRSSMLNIGTLVRDTQYNVSSNPLAYGVPLTSSRTNTLAQESVANQRPATS